MKKLLIKSFVIIGITMLFSWSTSAQTIAGLQYSIGVYPVNPTENDTVYVAFTYVSNDGCPDYYLVVDSVVDNRIYVAKKEIKSDRACTQVISKFTAKLILGRIVRTTQVYFEGALIKTIIPQCVMNKTGIVVAGTDACAGRLLVQEITPLTVIRNYAFANSTLKSDEDNTSGLKVGDKVKFGAHLNNSDSSTVQLCNIAGYITCWTKIADSTACAYNRKGVAKELTENSTLISDVQTGEIFEIFDKKLSLGTVVVFEGALAECKTSPCYNVVQCYRIVSDATSPCVKNKKGVVVAGKDVFAGRLFIQEMSPISAYIPIYEVKETNTSNMVPLKLGDKVIFGGYLQRNDSAASAIYPFKIVGVATCWEIIRDTVSCIMDRKGTVTGLSDNGSIVKDNDTGEIFEINGVKLSNGTVLKFKGTLIQCIATPCYNQVNCYQIVSVPPAPCVMDKKGVVVKGSGDCAGQLFIEYVSPAAIALRQLFKFENNTLNSSGVALPVLKVGDQVNFGGYFIKNDSNSVRQCNVVGIATCWEVVASGEICVKDRKGVVTETTDLFTVVKDIATGELFNINGEKLTTGTVIIFKGVKIECFTTPCYNIVECYQIISAPPTPCVLDKTGEVVQGVDGCTGRLFIREITENSDYTQLYVIQNYLSTNSDGTTITKLQPGDKVKFGGYLTKNDSTKSILCYTVGVATCYELIASENTYNLEGKVFAGNELMISGLAVLFRKGDGKAVASFTISDGTFTFKNLPEAAYTVYVIPDISVYKNYLPTFYINKFLYSQADFIRLNADITNMVIYLTNLNAPIGTGRIYGNIYFESDQLKDSILAAKGTLNSITGTSRMAENTPVVLYDNLSQPIAWTITDAAGNYAFENLSFNSYRIVSETAMAKAEVIVSINSSNSSANADLILKSPQENTALNRIDSNVMNFYPNPVIDRLIIQVKDNEQLNIYSAVGQLILSRPLLSGTNIIDVSNISNGVYIAKIGNQSIRMLKR